MRCTGIHNFLTTITFTPEEKQFLANGLNFIPTPPTSRTDEYKTQYVNDDTRGVKRFTRTLKNLIRFSHDTDDRSITHLPKFSVTNRRCNDEHINNELLENFHSEMTELETFNKSITRSLTKAIDTPTHQPPRSNYEREDIRFIHRLVNDPRITIKPADKNLGITLVDTEQYQRGIKLMLADTNTYLKYTNQVCINNKIIKCTSDKLGEHLYTHLQSLMTRHSPALQTCYPEIHDQVMKYIKGKIGKSTSTIPIIYGLMKVHKPKLTMRPIVPCTKWITTPASVLVDHFLQSLLQRANISWIVKDTKSLVNELEQTHLTPRTGILITADIASLYTNIETKMGLSMRPLLPSRTKYTIIFKRSHYGSTNVCYALLISLI